MIFVSDACNALAERAHGNSTLENRWRVGGSLHVRTFLLQLDLAIKVVRLCFKCDDTRAEIIFLLSAKRTSPFKSAGASVQSATCSRGVRISGSRLRLKCDGTRAESRFCLSAKRTSPFKSAGASVRRLLAA